MELWISKINEAKKWNWMNDSFWDDNDGRYLRGQPFPSFPLSFEKSTQREMEILKKFGLVNNGHQYRLTKNRSFNFKIQTQTKTLKFKTCHSFGKKTAYTLTEGTRLPVIFARVRAVYNHTGIQVEYTAERVGFRPKLQTVRTNMRRNYVFPRKGCTDWEFRFC